MLKTKEKVKVALSIEVMDIQNIKEVEKTFEIPFMLYLSWFDGRLKYKNLKKDKEFNLLSTNEKEKIWRPIINFKNTNEKLKTLVDKETNINVEKKVDDTFTPTKISEAENAKIYKGEDNQILIQRYYRQVFTCK